MTARKKILIPARKEVNEVFDDAVMPGLCITPNMSSACLHMMRNYTMIDKCFLHFKFITILARL